MSRAVFRIIQAGPHTTVQDGGRFGFKRFGVTTCGAMDRTGFRAAQRALGTAIDAPAIEMSLGGMTLDCVEGALTYAIAGGGFVADVAGQRFGSWSVRTIKAGETLRVRAGPWGCWSYLSFAGTLQTKAWLGSASTHGASGLGGGVITAGDELIVQDAQVLTGLNPMIPCPIFARPRATIRVVLGPQDQHFDPQSITDLQTDIYRLSGAYDRMGVRLQGTPLQLKNALSIPSEPIGRGAIQVSGDGTPTVLLADHQTTGGYPKIATIISSDIDQFAQLRPNQSVRFQAITAAAAIGIARARGSSLIKHL